MKIFTIFTILTVLFLATESREYKYHLTLKPDVFDVYWSVNTDLYKPPDNTFYFKLVARTTGWAALGWSITPEGRGMIQFDVALGGVRNGNDSYLNDYFSHTEGRPDLDLGAKQSLVLTNATEANGFTTIEFNREAITLDSADVPLKNGTKTWLMWGIATTDATNPTTFSKHSDKGYTTVPYDMFTGEQMKDANTVRPPVTTEPPTMSAAMNIVSSVLVVVLLKLGTLWMIH